MNKLRWHRATKGEQKGQYIAAAHDCWMQPVPHSYIIRRGTSEEGGSWVLCIDGEPEGGSSTLDKTKAEADRHFLKALKGSPQGSPKIVSTFKPGDRVTSPKGTTGTVIRVTGANTAVVRVDYEMEFDLTGWNK